MQSHSHSRANCHTLPDSRAVLPRALLQTAVCTAAHICIQPHTSLARIATHFCILPPALPDSRTLPQALPYTPGLTAAHWHVHCRTHPRTAAHIRAHCHTMLRTAARCRTLPHTAPRTLPRALPPTAALLPHCCRTAAYCRTAAHCGGQTAGQLQSTTHTAACTVPHRRVRFRTAKPRALPHTAALLTAHCRTAGQPHITAARTAGQPHTTSARTLPRAHCRTQLRAHCCTLPRAHGRE
jgi:hypothetical protein